MGNELSGKAPSGLEIDEKAIEITDFWIHHRANIRGSNIQNLSVFISEPSLHSSASFGGPSPLEKAAKNLMLHRHPCILKYVTSWSKGSKFFLSTEEVKPLVQVIELQTSLQICVGLHSILQALLFLHDKAVSLHNNICCSSIYVSTEGNWKLGGLEFLCQIADINTSYFRKIKSYRYDKAIIPDEEKLLSNGLADASVIDKYAFAVLAEEVLKLKDSDDVPGLLEFKELCKNRLEDISLTSLSKHTFFTHDFMRINAFLRDLPIKAEGEKEDFFLSLVTKLKQFPEKIVAKQLGKLLLSRMVLLDPTAQTKLLPFILKPKEQDDDSGLFTISTFQIDLIPQLLQMFCVRDAAIRLLLLSHLNSFVRIFQIDDLKHKVLPELLVGIKDTDDNLVGMTLRALADLIPILGSSTVIGGNRSKLFTDGRPNKSKRYPTKHVTFGPTESVKTASVQLNSEIPTLYLPERLSPDGGEMEAISAASEEENLASNEEETWSDWDAKENDLIQVTEAETILIEDSKPIKPPPLQVKNGLTDNNYKKPVIKDISDLDIKYLMPTTQEASNEIDFFSDMEPVIQKTQVLHVSEIANVDSNTFSSSLLPINDNGIEDNADGWGQSDWDS